MKANLLLHLDSVAWKDLGVDQSKELDDLALAIDCANEHGDRIFNNPNLHELVFQWGALYELIVLDEKIRREMCPWFDRQHQRILAKLLGRGATPSSSGSLTQLEQEFVGQNNGWLGLTPIDIPWYVSDEISWFNLHKEFILTKYDTIDHNTTYFHRFYEPILRVPPNSVNSLIHRKMINPIFRRLDIPTIVASSKSLHSEQVQMHFNDKDKSALNIDGTWKHGSFIIPQEARTLLISWGFKVPD